MDLRLSQFQETAEDRGAWPAAWPEQQPQLHTRGSWVTKSTAGTLGLRPLPHPGFLRSPDGFSEAPAPAAWAHPSLLRPGHSGLGLCRPGALLRNPPEELSTYNHFLG